ncbi:MAG: nucleotidyltransferase domain-containing protein [Nanoarchaeota archaeon]|nr:nucleotidyltransferase domain-containing protein [Nanoarchaeota archaeon]
MSQKVNKLSENHLKILSVFTSGFDKKCYIREVQKLLKISTRTAQLVLQDLEKRGILGSKTVGKNKMYGLVPTILAKEYVLLAENYKTIQLLERQQVIKDLVEKLLPAIKGVAMIFGSYSKGLQKKDSDLDILVVGTCDRKKVRELSRLYGLEISVKQYAPEIFWKKLHKDILIKEVLDNHVLLSGREGFIDKVIDWTR